MAATGILALCATVCAGVSGFTFVRAWGARDGARRRATDMLQQGKRSRILSLLQRGCAPLKPVARKLLAIPAVRRSAVDLTDMLALNSARDGAHEEVSLDAGAVLSVVLAAASLVAAAVSIATASAICGIACGTCGVLLAFTRARTFAEKRMEAVREEVPEALRSMGVCFRSGLSLLQTLKQVAHELDGSLGTLFDTAARRLEMGATTTEALAVFDTARQVPELTFVAVALDAQHQSGGSIAAVLESAQESVESELELRRSLRVQTTQAKLSARIVTLMPFLLVALFSLMSPGFLEPFFTSLPGMALLGLALGMQLAGTLIVHRMLKANAE